MDNSMSRKKKLLLNTLTGVGKQLVAVICGFILPRYMLLYYGSAVNGLIASISNFLSFISLLDMGVGAVIQSNLYKPLADNDADQISKILKSSKKFFRRLAYIFLAYIVILCFVVPVTVQNEFDTWFTVSLLVIISISTLTQYLFGMTDQLLLNADQRSYVQLLMQIGTIVLNTVLSIIMMKAGFSVHYVKLMTAAVYVLRPLGQMYYVRNHYTINRKIEVIGEPIRQKWNGFSQHMAAVVTQNIDIVVLTLFSTLQSVSVYSVYYTITSGVQQIILTAATGLESMFGNMIARDETEKLLKTFNAVEWVVHTSVTVIFTIAAVTIVPFVSVYTKGVTDANYIEPLFGTLLVLAYASLCLRVPYFRLIKAAGHYKETQNGAYISAGINIVVTITLVFKFGLVGAAIGTLAAMLFHTCYFVWYLKDNIIKRSIWPFVKYAITDIVVFAVGYIITHLFLYPVDTYIMWCFLAIQVSLAIIAISAVVNFALYRKQIKSLLGLIKK